MRYELFLRSRRPLQEQDLEQMAADLARQEQGLALEAYREDGAILGLDLGADPELPGAAASLCRAAFALERQHELSVFDPQLGRLVTEADEELIGRRVADLTAFGQGALSPTAPTGSSSLKLWLVVAGAVVLMLLLGKVLRCAV